MRKKIIITTLICCCRAVIVLAQPVQDKAELEKERQQIQNELKQIQSVYDRVKGQSKQAFSQLNAINNTIRLQERYIGTISKEIKMIDDDLYLSNLEIYRLQKQLDTLKTEYARTVVYAYKNRSSYDYLNFIFSANNFNDAIKRISYLRSYRTYREKQVKTILETQDLIAKRQEQQKVRKDQKGVALENETREKTVLDAKRQEKAVVVNQLKSQEKDLQKQIAEKKKRDAKLKSAIFAIIEREKNRANEDEKKRKATIVDVIKPSTPTSPDTKTVDEGNRNRRIVKEKTYVPLNENETALAANFKSNYGKLPWPVDNGVVCSNFGINRIEGTILNEDNPGITICTSNSGVNVKTVFDGEILSVFNLGDAMSVMIKHGNYYTIYSNLSSASVTKGTVVKTGQIIGRGGSDEDGGGKVDFILMIDKKNVNPQLWLHRK